MRKFKYIKTNQQMYDDLFKLWNNTELYVFLKGSDYIKQQEHEICHIMTKQDRYLFIELTRFDWLMLEQDKKKP